jgi:formylglycine-generating enzyme required for sulfatase activity
VTNSGLVFAGPITPNPALNMVAIPPGTFLMGTTAGFGHEGPVHQVTISRPFWIGRYETTQAQYQAVMGTNPSYFQGSNAPNSGQRPVENVSWNMAVAYCSALTALEQAAGRVPAGYHYRLPTEAEWEYCCRAGTTTEWNTGTSLNTSQANFQGVLANSVYGAGQTAVVGSYAPNAFGLHDTHGNVWEWVLDSLLGYSSSAPVVDPFVTGLVDRVRRGGSFDNLSHSGYCRSTRRGSSNAAPLWACGYRVVLGPIVNP